MADQSSLPDAPTDGITGLQFLDDTLLASSSWDGHVRVHSTTKQELMVRYPTAASPCLSVAGTPTTLVAGTLQGSVLQWDVVSGQETKLGAHEASCKCVAVVEQDTLWCSAGWDRQWHLWDVRTAGKAVQTVELPGKAIDMDISSSNQQAIVACSDRQLAVIDARKGSLVETRESSLSFPTRCVRWLPNEGVAIGSLEGRVSVELNSKQYAFKCHRVNDLVYPVNAIAVHPVHGTFATGGADGTVGTWPYEWMISMTGSLLVVVFVSHHGFHSDMGWSAQEETYKLSLLSNLDCRSGIQPRRHPTRRREQLYFRRRRSRTPPRRDLRANRRRRRCPPQGTQELKHSLLLYRIASQHPPVLALHRLVHIIPPLQKIASFQGLLALLPNEE